MMLEPQLRAYAALSAAALATGASASAQTIHNITSVSGATTLQLVGSGSTSSAAFQFSLGAGTANFSFRGHGPTDSASVAIKGAGGLRTNLNFPLKLGTADAVQGGVFHFSAGGGAGKLFSYRTWSVPHFQGNFQPPSANGFVNGYVGFKSFPDASHHYYGWVRVHVTANAGRPNNVSLLAVNGIYGAYALNGITAGATAIPEPASMATGLALFALGAVGVREFRKRRLAG